MAAEGDDNLRKRKRKRCFGTRKLLCNETVEVRSEEDGFQGSWHQGTVIASVRQVRHVRYDHILTDDGSENLVEEVKVSPAINGIACSGGQGSNQYRIIRPLPPPLEISKGCLTYGLCVDVNYKEAWWEGVIFDHKDGSEKRRIFFPELGDEMMAGVDSLRVTQDWDEFLGVWQLRGTWLFLLVIEEIAREWYIAASVKQIWYDLRENKAFQSIGNWTYSNEAVWKKFVLEVIKDGLRITLEHLFQDIGLQQSSVQESRPLPESVTAVGNHDINSQPFTTQCYAVVPTEQLIDATQIIPTSIGTEPCRKRLEMNQVVCVSEDNRNATAEGNDLIHEKAMTASPQPLSVLHSTADVNFSILSVAFDEGPSSSSNSSMNLLKPQRSANMESTPWVPVRIDIVPDSKPCPDAILNYAFINKLYSGGNIQQLDGSYWCCDDLIKNVRKHLRHHGWRIEFKQETGSPRMRVRYISPEGKCYRSLNQICQNLIKSNRESLFMDDEDKQQNLLALTKGSLSSPNEEHYQYQDSKALQLIVASSQSKAVVIEQENCPQAVYDWFMNGYDETQKCSFSRKELLTKAKRHLSALGWTISRETTPKGRSYFCYTAPRGKKYFSVRQACINCVKESKRGPGNASACRILGKTNAKKRLRNLTSIRKSSAASGAGAQRSLVLSGVSSEVFSGDSCMPQSRKAVKFSSLGDQTNGKLQRRRKNNLSSLVSKMQERPVNSCAQSTGLQRMMPRKPSKRLVKYKNNINGHRPIQMLRSGKKVQEVVNPTSSDCTPRSVLSWLIDSNVVSQKEKVHYFRKKDGKPIAEGEITRQGILCMCCEEVYSLSSFEAHAGSTCHRPAANIFLEDGRSLLDCQMQMKCKSKMKNLRPRHHQRFKEKRQEENDYICSICHYGGELILCDQCPSSFHKDCLGIENIPEGDWFCPSCRCQICGQRKLKKDAENIVNEPILCCGQCERKYHIDCLFHRGIGANSCLKETWFCDRKCEEIFLGLHELLRNPIEIGVDNLTWRLVKSVKPDVHDVDALVFETENYSKLSVAVAVMHECFDPVREPRTRRDLAEDIIFSRGSELNRLNFRGFYTVLLERNEEIITVATVRVHGEKVAEVPLIGTRFQYRRQGMCRILMNELGKKLMELGVERLVLPAVPSVLHTWTTSFGFSEMTPSERLKFVDCTFLDFQDTVMCQKLLQKKPSADFRPQEGTGPKLGNDVISGNENVDLDGSSAVSEVCHEAQIDENGSVNQEQLEGRQQLKCYRV